MERNYSLLSFLLCVFLGAGLVIFMPINNGAMNMQVSTAEQNQSKKPLFACNLLALDKEARKRHSEVAKQVQASNKEIRELSDGYEFRFSSDQPTILLVSEFVARERLCCPFFTFEMVIEPEAGPLWLRLKGPDGVKEFIRIEFGLK